MSWSFFKKTLGNAELWTVTQNPKNQKGLEL